MSSPSDALLSEAVRLRDEAYAAMTQLARDTSACARAKDGQSFPAYKFHEGRATALGQVARQIRTAGNDAAVVIAEHALRWQQQVDQCRTRGPDWQAYAAGGLDAMHSIEALLAAGETSGDPTVR